MSYKVTGCPNSRVIGFSFVTFSFTKYHTQLPLEGLSGYHLDELYRRLMGHLVYPIIIIYYYL